LTPEKWRDSPRRQRGVVGPRFSFEGASRLPSSFQQIPTACWPACPTATDAICPSLLRGSRRATPVTLRGPRTDRYSWRFGRDALSARPELTDRSHVLLRAWTCRSLPKRR